MLQKMPVTLLPDMVLRMESKIIKTKEIAKWQELIESMIATMYANKGIGIAAPQVGVSIQLVIIDTDKGPLALFNPKIVKKSSETAISEEGCLSVPKKYGDVRRSLRLKVQALDRAGKPVKFSASGLFARVIQHEIDHIHGILFIDKVQG